MADFTADDFNGLADKLDALDLTDNEGAILDAILSAAAGDAVRGFMVDKSTPLLAMKTDFDLRLLTDRGRRMFDTWKEDPDGKE